MSYSVFVYSVNLDRLGHLFGSKDKQVVLEIKKQFSDDIKEHNDWFEEEIKGGAPTLNQAIEEIVEGVITHELNSWQYGYALEIICRYMGKQLSSESLESLNSSGLQLLESIDGVGELVLHSRPPMSIPIPQDFPTIGHMPYQTVVDKLAKLTSIEFSGSEAYIDWQDDVWEEYKQWLEEAKASCQGLVTFLY